MLISAKDEPTPRPTAPLANEGHVTCPRVDGGEGEGEEGRNCIKGLVFYPYLARSVRGRALDVTRQRAVSCAVEVSFNFFFPNLSAVFPGVLIMNAPGPAIGQQPSRLGSRPGGCCVGWPAIGGDFHAYGLALSRAASRR